MTTSEKQIDTVYFSFNNIKYLSGLLLGSISIGVIMNIFMSYRAFGMGIVIYRNFSCLVVVTLISLLYYLRTIKLSTGMVVIGYFIIACYTLVLPFLFKVDGFNFYSNFLEIEFLVMLFGLILTIGVKPYHDLILGTYNFLFFTICVVLVPEFQLETYLFYISIVSAKCIICYVIFEQVFKLRRKMKIHHETIIRQNAELLELTKFRKDIIRIIAHDLRTPIHQIASLLDVVKDTETEKERNEVMAYLNKSVSNAYSMLENLLKWAMQNNEGLKEFTMINVSDLIQSVEYQLSDQIRNKNLKIIKRIAYEEEVFYSKNVIESVARNLLMNAVKFSPSDEEITIHFDNRDTTFSLQFFNKTKAVEMENIHQFNEGKAPLRSTNGTAKEIGSGNGLIVCREMLEKNNGKLRLDVKDNGVIATIFISKEL